MGVDIFSTSIFHPELYLRVRVKRSFFNAEWVDIKVIQFSTRDMLIKTDENFTSGDILQLSLKFNCHPSPVVIDTFYAQAISKTKECSCYLYHLNLEHIGVKKNSDQVFKYLRQIELMVLKEKAIKKKRKCIQSAS